MKAATERKILRYVHLVGAIAIGMYIYSPWSDVQWFTLFNQVVVVPALGLSGIWMWWGHRIRRRFGKGKN